MIVWKLNELNIQNFYFRPMTTCRNHFHFKVRTSSKPFEMNLSFYYAKKLQFKLTINYLCIRYCISKIFSSIFRGYFSKIAIQQSYIYPFRPRSRPTPMIHKYLWGFYGMIPKHLKKYILIFSMFLKQVFDR